MANYESRVVTRTPFMVKNIEAFMAEIGATDSGLWVYSEKKGMWIGGNDVDFTPLDENDEEVDVLKIIQSHLAEGQCAVLYQIVYEKLRYLNAILYVVTPDDYIVEDAFHSAELRLIQEYAGLKDLLKPLW